MIRIVKPDTMRALEQIVMASGVSEAELIERAAGKIADYLDRHVSRHDDGSPREVLAVAGPGNNGVDALVAAAILQSLGWNAKARLVGRKNLSDIAAGGKLVSGLDVVDNIPEVDVIIDGIFGNSGRTKLPAEAITTLDDMRSAVSVSGPSPLVAAIDCPTGTDTLNGNVADALVPAGVTFCISNPKIGMLKAPAIDSLGELIVLDIGVRSDDLDPDVRAAMIDEPTIRRFLRARPATAHKSQVGGLLIVGGAPSYYGAPRLAGEAALRSGCGYVGLAVPRSIAGTIASAVPELIFHPTSDADGRRSAAGIRTVVAEGNRYQALVIGPGLGRDEVASDLLQELLEPRGSEVSPAPAPPVFGIPRQSLRADANDDADISGYPLVLDADALNWLSEQSHWQERLEGRDCVLTPHAGEMARLLGVEPESVSADPWNVAREAAREWGQVVVLKASIGCIATPDGDVFVAPRTTPELATPGTGDVLAGMIGAFIAQGHSGPEAAVIALYVGAMAGRAARLQRGTRGVIARDVINSVPDVLKSLDDPFLGRLEGLA